MKKRLFLLILVSCACAAPRYVAKEPQPAEWDGTPQQWAAFEQCVNGEMTDFKCDSCYRAIRHKFPKP